LSALADRPEVSSALREALRRALSPNPSSRFASIADLLAHARGRSRSPARIFGVLVVAGLAIAGLVLPPSSVARTQPSVPAVAPPSEAALRAAVVSLLAGSRSDDRDATRRQLAALAHEAWRSGADDVAATLGARLCRLALADGANADARRWRAWMRTALERYGDVAAVVDVALCDADAAMAEGDATGALHRLAAAMPIADADGRATLRLRRAQILFAADRFAEAAEALHAFERTATPLAAPLRLARLELRAKLRRRARDVEGALADLREALVLARTTDGERSRAVARITAHLAALTGGTVGDFDTSVRLWRRVVRLEEELGIPDVDRGKRWIDLANDLADAGRLDEASAAMERALVLLQAGLGSESPDLSIALHAAGMLAVDRGDVDRASSYLEHARANLLAAPRFRPSTLAYVEAGRAEVALVRGDFAVGLHSALVARRLRAAYDPRPGAIAYAELLEARARWGRAAPGDRAAAVDLATTAATRAEQGSVGDASVAHEARSWLAAIGVAS
jgi:tetratricopeptide (TPR) repeat protein